MAHPSFLRDKARQLRRDRHLTIDEISARLAVPRTTVFSWVRDMPIERTCAQAAAQRRGTRAMQERFRRARQLAYAEGLEAFAALSREPTFRDFVALYIAEGSKRARNTVSICNSDPAAMRLAMSWIRRLTSAPLKCAIQYHADQDVAALATFWAAELRIPDDAIRLQRKSNSGRLTGRTWRSRYGVLSVTCHDTLLRARLQAWMDRVRDDWLHSPETGA